MPVCPLGRNPVNLTIDQRKQAFQPCVEALQVERHAVKVVLVRRLLGAGPSLLGTANGPFQIGRLGPDPLRQRKQPDLHRSIPSRSIA